MTPLLSTPTQPLPSHAAQGHDISVLPQIFEAPINIAIFQRKLPAELAVSANAQSQTTRDWHYAWLGAPEEAFMADLKRKLPSPEAGDALVEDVATIAQAIAYLFDTDSVGIRLRLLTAAMCPRFHCDNLGYDWCAPTQDQAASGCLMTRSTDKVWAPRTPTAPRSCWMRTPYSVWNPAILP